jgi:predicted CoA-binding protein
MPEKSTRADLDAFVNQKTIAIVGVSRNPKKFGNLAFRELKARGYRVFPVNRNMDQIEGTACFKNLAELPEKVDTALLVVPANETEKVVQEAEAAGIMKVWMQQGSESDGAIRYCREQGMTEVHGECMLMLRTPCARTTSFIAASTSSSASCRIKK